MSNRKPLGSHDLLPTERKRKALRLAAVIATAIAVSVGVQLVISFEPIDAVFEFVVVASSCVLWALHFDNVNLLRIQALLDERDAARERKQTQTDAETEPDVTDKNVPGGDPS